ncbi:MAG: hypothetical protein ACD_52C00102G0002 [uncultured bacterium]|nr:MAG: hypothetical protein ACD_52C00102G0002 [uncultured bacterium]
MTYKTKLSNSQGQAVLLVVLTLAVVLTLVLSIVARTITDVQTTSVEEDSLRAFSAAEAGIERHLNSSTYTFTDFAVNNVEVTGSITPKYNGDAQINYPEKLKEGEVATVWFVEHDSSGNLVCDGSPVCYDAANANSATLRLCWGETGGPDAAAEISIYYDPDYDFDFSDVQVARFAVDPVDLRADTNNFKDDQSGITGCTAVGDEAVSYIRRMTINLDDTGSLKFDIPDAVLTNEKGLLFARVRFYYNGSGSVPFGMTLPGGGGNSVFASQARVIESSGRFGDAERSVEVTALYPDLPPIFDYSLFSLGGSLSQ